MDGMCEVKPSIYNRLVPFNFLFLDKKYALIFSELSYM